MSQGLKINLNRYGIDVKPEMVSSQASCLGATYHDVKNAKALCLASEVIKDLSGVDREVWNLMELATALKIICYPAESIISEEEMLTRHEVKTLVGDAHKYEGKIDKDMCLKAYHQIVECQKHVANTRKILEFLLPD
ncbi:hypothetical protein BS78_08G117400 [Paspalum vaginatum]|nr:hypothetical protein BS78_08G117400 [Paspalum vaginatum]